MSLINPNDTVERQNEKLLQIAHSLMRRVEQKNEQSGLAYQQFERAALLETEVRERTHDLERALDLLQESNARLEIANDETEKARSNLTEAIETINEGFALFEEDDGLVLSNSRFCRDLIDIEGGLVAGLSFEGYVWLVSESEFLALPDNQSPQDWATQRLSRHREDHVVFNVRLKWDRWLQVSEHRTSRGGTVILQTDVTSIIRRERQERDRMRDKQAEILQATLDHLNQGVCIFDNGLSLVGLNSKMEELMAGTPVQAGLGMTFSDLFDQLKDELGFEGEFDATALRRWAHSRSKRQPIAFEVSRSNKRHYNVFAQEIPDRGFVISFTDVTAERAAARTLSDMNELLERRVQDRTNELGLALAEAERANASKSRFVAAASHDLLQPLSAAKLFVSSLSEEIDTSAAYDVMQKTEMALNSVEQFISALLDISKLDADRVEFDVQPLQLSQILTPLRSELTPVADQNGNRLTVVDSSLTVLSDPGYLRRIVQNLLVNAIRYTDKGRILVGVRRRGLFARIEVWDTGHGIAQEDQLTIFREFERLSPTKSDMGLGLGLAIVERACKGLEHDFNLWSEPGVGSCFSVDIRIAQKTRIETDAAASSLDSALEHSDSKLSMLIGSDPSQVPILTEMIEAFGCTVIHANDGLEALAILEEIQLVPDALVIDQVPKQSRDGLDVYRMLKGKHGLIPCAILAGGHDASDAAHQTPAEVSYLANPTKPDQLDHFLKRSFCGEVRRKTYD
ncbi:signal transduction histidine kinase [Litoreibacter ponti]|uniref:histidine kinase n=1 Tax=Litoreibacter ponti TaxID=1510457 RepID=A0A2T6BF50_9RHOB|nr:PAS-domain containing protein [Litoreibacter ponti]PTX54681.1 signal transduction histidine kinase [Litoreibacter ponti]